MLNDLAPVLLLLGMSSIILLTIRYLNLRDLRRDKEAARTLCKLPRSPYDDRSNGGRS